MKLRQQLVILSLITLVLPWTGMQYVREMDKVMKAGQVLAMEATARALAASINNNPQTRELMLALGDRVEHSHTYYLHPLPEMVLDGYADDWLGLPYTPDAHAVFGIDGKNHGKAKLGFSGEYLYMFIRIHDPERQYHNPTHAAAAFDHLSVFFAPEPSDAFGLNVFTAAPGQVQVRVNQTQGAPRGSENWLKGFWRETSRGFDLELRLPLNAVDAGFSLRFVGAEQERSPSAAIDWAAVTRQERALNRLLNDFEQEGIRLSLFQPSGFLLAQHGDLEKGRYRVDARWQQILGMMLRAVSSGRDGQQYQPFLTSGQMQAAELSALTQAPFWSRRGRYEVAQVAVPIEFQNQPAGDKRVGWAVVEQSTVSMNLLMDSATGQLMLYSILASLLAALVFIAYASWLSFRVKKLSRAANLMVDAKGKFQKSFPVSKNPDELGDLSRSFSTLFLRLRDYTQYLETLASKLSHELRTPLAVVKSSLENLRYQNLSDEAKVYTERAQEGAERLSVILNAMSAATRLEQSLESSELERVDLAKLLRELLPVYQGLPSSCTISWKSEPSTALPVDIAPELLVQAIDKLVENALDFCPEGGSVAFSLDAQKQWAVLQIANNGPMLKEEMQSQIFESLVSVREETHTGQHLGLGLYIVRTVVLFHKGRVRAFNDVENKQVVFEISLPLVSQ